MNTKHKNYKKYLEVQRRKHEILTAQRNLGYEKLDKPYQKGWDGYWGLRDDVTRSEEGKRLQVLLDNFGKTISSNNKEFRIWSRDDRKYHYHKPSFRLVPEDEWVNFHSWAKKWFEHDPSEDKDSWYYSGVRRFYKCIIPEWMLVMKKEKHWVTHYKVHDEVLEQEYAELDTLEDKLIDYRSWYTFGKSGKPYKKFRNKEFRGKEKRGIRKVMRTREWDDINLPKPRKCILWDMY